MIATAARSSSWRGIWEAASKDGIAALDLLRGTSGAEKLPRPYLIMLDLNMPRMGGIELLDAIGKDPALKDAVVFVLTTSDAEVLYRSHHHDRALLEDHRVSGSIKWCTDG